MQKYIISLPKVNKHISGKKRSFSDENNNDNICKARNISAYKYKTQMYIDLGQKSFNEMKKCKLCEMIYVVNDKEDEINHIKYCKESLKIPSLSNLIGYKIVEKFDDDKYIVIKVFYHQIHSNKSIQEVISLMKLELGSSDDIIKPSDTIYLCLHNSFIVSCIVCEKIDHDQRILINDEVLISKVTKINDSIDHKLIHNKDYNKSNDKIYHQGNNTLSKASILNENISSSSSSTVELIVGIKLIWVHYKFRRLHIAHHCLDVVRKRYQYGYILKTEDLAFSQPTSDGYQLACSYLKSKSIWIY